MKGKLAISQFEKTKDDLSFNVNGASLVRIYVSGQNYLQVDDGEVIPPGEAFIEGDISGPGIDHEYRLVFLTNPSPPTVELPRVRAGNHVIIRLLKRKDNG